MPKETLEGEHWRAFRLFLASLEDRELKQVGQQLNRERAVRRECQDSQLRLFFSSLSASDLEVARHTISNERFARAHDRRLVARAVGAAQVSIQIIIGSLALCRGQSDECPDCGSLPRKEKIRMNASEKQDANSSAENTAPKPRSAPHIGSKPEAKASKAKRRRKPSAAARPGTKAAKIVALLRRSTGASLQELRKATGWEPHSVRGFLSGTVKKKMGLRIDSIQRENGDRAYQLVAK